MKKITLLAVAFTALTFASCKKDRTCTCKTTTTSEITNYTGGGSSTGSNFGTTEDKTVMTKVSKKTAKTNCVSNENTNTDTEINYTKTTITKTDCTLS
ncbi:MAG: hypothetical protein HY062_15965 [Bacteroidetes bacterium]|nr:hypothetical protein [Bacteroidota bacterium]